MTALRRDGCDTPFGNWIRHHPGLDSIQERLCVIDTDYWLHRYRAHSDRVGERAVDSLMLVELKTNSGQMREAQRDTLYLVNELLRIACVRPDGRRRYVTVRSSRAGEMRRVRCYGVHLLQLSGDRPDTSETILWDGLFLTEELLVEILRFDRDPDHPMRSIELRRHHSSRKAANLVLFGGGLDMPQ